MDIKTHVRKKNVKTAEKILRKGRGAWGEFVNRALEREILVSSTYQPVLDKKLQEFLEKQYKADKEAS